MTDSTQYIMKIQELVELQDLNKTCINMTFIVVIKSRFWRNYKAIHNLAK